MIMVCPECGYECQIDLYMAVLICPNCDSEMICND